MPRAASILAGITSDKAKYKPTAIMTNPSDVSGLSVFPARAKNKKSSDNAAKTVPNPNPTSNAGRWIAVSAAQVEKAIAVRQMGHGIIKSREDPHFIPDCVAQPCLSRPVLAIAYTPQAKSPAAINQ